MFGWMKEKMKELKERVGKKKKRRKQKCNNYRNVKILFFLFSSFKCV